MIVNKLFITSSNSVYIINIEIENESGKIFERRDESWITMKTEIMK